MKLVGKKPKLTAEQANALRERYESWRHNRPSKLMREFGLTESTFRNYIGRLHKHPV